MREYCTTARHAQLAYSHPCACNVYIGSANRDSHTCSSDLDTGSTNGNSHTGALNINTSASNCDEYIYVYQYANLHADEHTDQHAYAGSNRHASAAYGDPHAYTN